MAKIKWVEMRISPVVTYGDAIEVRVDVRMQDGEVASYTYMHSDNDFLPFFDVIMENATHDLKKFMAKESEMPIRAEILGMEDG